MYLNNYDDRIDLLVDWILETLPSNAAVLDVGANDGSFCPQVRRIADAAQTYSGVDPDAAKLARHTFLDQRFPSKLEDADIPPGSFDYPFANYVLEHVSDPEKFMQAVGRLLRPGGSFYFITPNQSHYFALISRALTIGDVQGKLLGKIRQKELVEEYHYPATYQMNSPKRLRKLGTDAGFDQFEFRYSERLSEIDCYFPGPTKVLPWAWEQLAKVHRQEWLLLNLMGRMVKKA